MENNKTNEIDIRKIVRLVAERWWWFVLGVVFVIWPDLSTRCANLIGIGRGTDFLLYLLILFVYFSGMCILAKFRQIERRQTLLIRQLALRGAVKLGGPKNVSL